MKTRLFLILLMAIAISACGRVPVPVLSAEGPKQVSCEAQIVMYTLNRPAPIEFERIEWFTYFDAAGKEVDQHGVSGAGYDIFGVYGDHWFNVYDEYGKIIVQLSDCTCPSRGLKIYFHEIGCSDSLRKQVSITLLQTGPNL